MVERRGSRRKGGSRGPSPSQKGSRGPSPSQRSGGAGQDGKAAEPVRKEAGPGGSTEDSTLPGPIGGTAEVTVGGGGGQLKGLAVSSAGGGPSEAGGAGGAGVSASPRGTDFLSPPAAVEGLPVVPPPGAGSQPGTAASEVPPIAFPPSPGSNVVFAGRALAPLGPSGDGGASVAPCSSAFERIQERKLAIPVAAVPHAEEGFAGSDVTVRDDWEDAIAEAIGGLPTESKQAAAHSESASLERGVVSSSQDLLSRAVARGEELITEAEEEEGGGGWLGRPGPSTTAAVVVVGGANGGGEGEGGGGGGGGETSALSLSLSSSPRGSAGRVTDEQPVENSGIAPRGKPTGNVINDKESIEQPIAAALNAQGVELGRNRLEEDKKEEVDDEKAAAAAEVTSQEAAGEREAMVEKTAEVGEAAPAATPPSSGSVADISSSPATGAGEGGSSFPTTAEQQGAAASPPAAAAASAAASAHSSSPGPLSNPTPPTPPAPKRHPLYNHWTLWFDSGSSGGGRGGPGGRQAAWGSTLRPVYSFGCVEDFWCMYNNIKPPSDLRKGTDLHMFKRNVEPKWEDPVCEKGGKWTVASPGKTTLDAFWLNTLLALIGEQFDEGNDICGVVVNIREKDRISLWTSTATNEVRQMSIGKQWKVVLDLNEKSMMGFTAHEDAKSGGRSKNKELYYV